MSGGSWEYVYERFEDVAARLRSESDPRRRALGRVVAKMAKAMHDIEWVDSSDFGKGDEIAAIDAVIRHEDVLDELIEAAVKARDEFDGGDHGGAEAMNGDAYAGGVSAVPTTRCRRCNDPLPVGDTYRLTASVYAGRNGRTAMLEAADFCSVECVQIAVKRLAIDAGWAAKIHDCHAFGA